MALAALLLVPLYFVPFWTISMTAPQYPEGIGMYIHINDISGHSKHDIQSINTLNHYIGMQEIQKEDFAEIKVMPWIVGFMILFGLAAAASGNIKWVIAWLALMVVLAIAGLVDYYMWGYEYGHNLDPNAAIKVPGMSYQPPLIGSKELLNIDASSWPYWGTLFLSLSMVISAGIVWTEKFKKEK